MSSGFIVLISISMGVLLFMSTGLVSRRIACCLYRQALLLFYLLEVKSNPEENSPFDAGDAAVSSNEKIQQKSNGQTSKGCRM